GPEPAEPLEIGEIDLVDPALALQTEEARLLDRVDLVNRLRAVHVADRQISPLPQRVIRQLMLLQIEVHVPVAPVGDRMHLPAAAGPVEKRNRSARRALLAPEAGEPRARAELAQRAAHRLDLVLLVVGVQALEPLVPPLPVARLLPRRRELCPVDAQVQAQPLRQLV